MLIEISKELKIDGPPDFFERDLMARLSFQNPAFLEATERGRWTGNIPCTIASYTRDDLSRLTVPRGFARQLCIIARMEGIPFTIKDQRRTLEPVDFAFTGRLWDFQANAVQSVLAHDFGTLAAPTGSGKTVMALAIIAARRQPALILVHTRELAAQWVDRIGAFLGIPATDVGMIGSGKKRIGERITVALVQSLYRCASDVAQHVGFIVVDECHRTPSRTFTEAVGAFDSRYMLGLSATPWRRDKLSRLIFWHLGDVVHEVDRAALVEAGHLVEAEVVQRETSFRTDLDASEQYSRVLSELTIDPDRNAMIVADLAEAARKGSGICLALTDRKAHVETLHDMLRDQGIEAAALHGGLPAKERGRVVDALHEGKVHVLLATGQLIGEGFDLPALSALFLATPIRFSGRVLQYLGRVLRPARGKERATVVDFIDKGVPVLRASAAARAKIYKHLSAGG